MSLSLQHTDNYNTSLQNTERECFTHYVKLIQYFLLDFNKKIVYQNKDKQHDICVKGIQTIAHIFIFTLMYSNNIDLTVESTQKGYNYFIEFVSQMGEDGNILNIGLIDAIIFTYKKTIFDIPLDIKKDFKECNAIIPFIKKYIDIYNNIFINYSNITDTKPVNSDFLIPIYESIIQLPFLSSDLDTIETVVNRLDSKVTSLIYLCVVDQFIKYILKSNNKSKISCKKIETKFLCNNDDMGNFNSTKVLKWLTNE